MADETSSREQATGDVELPASLGQYTLLQQLARGERGDVYAALRPVQIDRFCAVKMLHGASSADPELMADLSAEALRVVRQIHGNVVQVYDIAQADERLFFVSELVDGVDLMTLLGALQREGRSMLPGPALFVATEVAAALSYLRRIAARAGDAVPLAIGPAAVMLTLEGDVKVVHYGATLSRLAAAAPERATDRAFVFAPELLAGAPASAASDVYVIGALLWLMLTGNPPGSESRPLPPAFRPLLLAMLSQDPAARPGDCDEVRQRLGLLARGLGSPGPGAVAALVKPRFEDGVDQRRAELARLAETGGRIRSLSKGRVQTLTRTDIRSKAPQPAIASDLTPGEPIAGTRYRVIAKIGEGGMGAVYSAEHIDLEKKVALKLLPGDIAHLPAAVQQFRQEARAASRIGSPYICDVTDFGELVDGRVFFIMEYLEGNSLGYVLRADAFLPPARAVGVLRQVAKALGAAHDKGIIHLDVKPDNVMLIARGRRSDAVKVVDFGIAGLLQEGKDSDQVAGTPEYIAPERAMGRGYDHRTDIYSLGVLAYEVLTGTVPFQGTTVTATLTMHARDQPVPLSRRAPERNVPPGLERLVMQMLQKDPASRPQSMAAVEAMLCEAQIEAGLTTDWDDLELPAVDDEWRAKLAARMPNPAGRPRKALLFGAVGMAVVGLGLATYFGVIRKPREVVREVRVEVTNTSEPKSVADWLVKADQAARARRYVMPPADSALFFIEKAEAEASRLKRRTTGGETLRRAYASALTVIGNELLDADLRDLALSKYKEALLFLPDDPELQAKAELTPEERQQVATRGRGGAPAEPSVPTRTDDANETATAVFLAVKEGRLLDARVQLKRLQELDASGMRTARLAEAIRKRARSAWTDGKRDAAQALYRLLQEIDPADPEAQQRLQPPPMAAGMPDAGAIAAGAGGAPGTTGGGTGPATGGKGGSGKRHPLLDEPADAPRDQIGSRKAAAAGVAAIARGQLAAAEESFNKAIRLDPLNPIAIGGLAEVAFERARYTEALDYARRATKLSPSARYYLLTGDAYFKLLRYRDAKSAYEKAAALNPSEEGIAARLERVKEKLR